METYIKFTCAQCQNIGSKRLGDYNKALKQYKALFCSRKCRNLSMVTKTQVVCTECGTQFLRAPNQVKKVKNTFCSRSCGAKYNNTHKTQGVRRSKLELYLEQELQLKFPNLTFEFNSKTSINSELDIYIPSLKLAFELNGIFHYEPIYGQDKLSQIQNNDNRKFQACLEQGIELCIIDTSSIKNFKPLKAVKYFDIITNIIQSRLWTS